MRSVVPSTQSHSDDVSDDDGGTFRRTLQFTYQHSLTLVAISIVWVLLSMPLVTVGPVTLGSYRAIMSLRETGQSEPKRIRSTVRRNFFASLLFGLGPPIFGGIGLLYVVSSPQWFGPLSFAIAAVALYVGLYLAVLLVPTFYGMASGDEPIEAFRTGYVSIAGNPITAVQLVVVTVGLFVISILLTISVVVIFPAFVITYHIHVADQHLAGRANS